MPKSEHPLSTSNQQQETTAPILPPEFPIPQPVINEYNSWKHESNRRERWKRKIEVCTLIGILAYTTVAAYQACQMRRATNAAQESTELLRQQLVGTQSATVVLHLSIYPNNELSVIFDHRGVVAAKEVRFVFRAIRKSIPSLDDIETAINHIACEPIPSPQAIYPPKEYGLPGFTPSVLEAIRRTEQTIMVAGEFSYDNGFGDVHSEEICMYWLSGIPNRTSDQGGANQFFPCEDFPIRMNNVLKAREEMQAH